MCGLIGWVGLLIPHFVRLVCGSDNRTVVPASFLFGAVFLWSATRLHASAAQMEISRFRTHESCRRADLPDAVAPQKHIFL